MHNTHRGQQKTGKKQNKGNGKKEKKVPKLIIRLGAKPAIIGNSDEENSINLKSNQNVGSFCTSIADQVKLRKRGQSSTSDAEIFKIISESSLPGKNRKRKNSSAFVSSKPVSLSSDSSSPTNSPLSVKTCKAMFQSHCDKSPIPSLTSELRTTKVLTTHSHNYVQCPSLNCEPYSTFDDASIKNDNVSRCDLPSKKAKLLECYPFINEEKSSATSSLVDIHQLEVASYEEVSSVEPLQTSSYPPEFFGVDDVPAVVPATSMLQGINSTSLPSDKEKPVLNTEKTNHTHSEVCREEQKNTTGMATLHDHDYPVTINKSFLEDIDVLDKELKILDSSVVEEFFSHAKELSVVQKRTNDYVDKMMDLAIQIEKQPYSQGISSKVNGLVNKDSSAVVFSTLKHSTQARDGQNITDLKNRINSRDFIKITKLARSSIGHALSSKTHARDDKNTHDKQENSATKEKKKAKDERCIVYVGNIPPDYNVLNLRKRFQKFGAIRDIQIKSKVSDLKSSDSYSLGSEEMWNYGFITFSCNQEAFDAIEGGNKGHELQFQLSFGARRQFVGEEYKDLDGIVAKNENSMYKHNSRSSFLPQDKEEDDFDIILKNAMKARGVKPQPFRMKCKA